MLEAGAMLLFCAVLFASVALGWSIIPALFVGVLLFMGYGLVRRCSLRAMASRAAGSVRSAGTVVVAFVLIGVLTSLWRASGTIVFIVAHSTAVIHAATVIPLSFLLCSAMSVLVGSSFASAATMGTICMSLGLSMQANPVMLGGAILAGVYVGDRCSPVSTSALLVKQLTHTNASWRLLRHAGGDFAGATNEIINDAPPIRCGRNAELNGICGIRAAIQHAQSTQPFAVKQRWQEPLRA